MPTKKTSVKLSKASRGPKRSKVAGDIIAGLKEVAAFARGEISLPVRMVNVPGRVNIRAIRNGLGLSQSEFAARYGFVLRTLQEWEQGRTQPESPLRAYLLVIERNPQAVETALSSSHTLTVKG